MHPLPDVRHLTCAPYSRLEFNFDLCCGIAHYKKTAQFSKTMQANATKYLVGSWHGHKGHTRLHLHCTRYTIRRYYYFMKE